MNTYKYITMMAVVALMLGACSEENISNMKPQQPTEGETIHMTATIADELQMLPDEDMDGENADVKPATRSTMSGGALSAWTTTDKISISDGTLMYTYLPDEESINGNGCSFISKTGTSFVTDGDGEEEGTFYAFYPADAAIGWNGTTLTTMIYTEQKYGENLDNSGVMGPYMVAQATTINGKSSAKFTFGHICSVIDVDLTGFGDDEVESVALYANSQISLAGRIKYDFSNKAATVSGNDGPGYSWSTQSEVVRVSEVNAKNPIVRFFVMPVRQTEGFTITVRTSDGNYYTKSSGTAVGTAEANEYMTAQSGITGGALCKPYYKKYNFGAKSGARVQNWMAMIPGNTKFNHISIPGTHDAATSSCTSSSAKCQEFTIKDQLEKGCRAFDLRPYYSSSTLEIHHGIANTKVTLDEALGHIKTFLEKNPTETVFVLIAQEGGNDGDTNWQNRVWDCINNYQSVIASYGWSGNLNPCRGKMVVIFRNTYTGGTNSGDLGCGKVGWGGSFADKPIATGSSNKGTLIYQDEYDTANTSTKLENLEKMLNEYIAPRETDAGYTLINNTNIAGTLSNISSLSKNMNEMFLGSLTFLNHSGKFGIMMVDFLFSTTQKGDQMFELIHKQNYKYVYKGRTRCINKPGDDTGITISGDEFADDGEVYTKPERF